MKSFEEKFSKLPVARQNKIKAMADTMALDVGLQKLREEMCISQQELANTMGISQSAVAQFENNSENVRLSTLKRYIEAMGGEISLMVQMPTGEKRLFQI